jgi:AraC-like DNA-binding protein
LSVPTATVDHVRHTTAHIAGDGFTVGIVACHDDHTRWSAPEPGEGHRIVLVRSGRFLLRSMGRESSVDPTTGYLQTPGDEQQFAHPAGGDVCTSIAVSEPLWGSPAGDRPRPTRPWLHIDARLELAHRRLARAIAGGDADFAIPERLLDLFAQATAQTVATPASDTVPRSHTARLLADAAREALSADHPASSRLTTLAAHLAVSPTHLSRTFRHETGSSLTRYRNRLRVSHALDRIEGGEDNLAVLAADLGFADQAHFIRTMREHTGHTPGKLRAVLHQLAD